MSAGHAWVRPQLRAALPDVMQWEELRPTSTGTVWRGADPRGVRWDVFVDEGEPGVLIVAHVVTAHGCTRAEFRGFGDDVSAALTKLRRAAQGTAELIGGQDG